MEEYRQSIIKREGFDLHVVWTCEIEEMVNADPEMQKFFENSQESGPIKLRDAFFGGNFY